MINSIVLSSQISLIPNEFPIVLCFQAERTARENQKQSLCILIACLYKFVSLMESGNQCEILKKHGSIYFGLV